jgi:hypothetical protein
MGVMDVRFQGQSRGGCWCRRVFSPLRDQKIAKIKGNIMMSLIQLYQ